MYCCFRLLAEWNDAQQIPALTTSRHRHHHFHKVVNGFGRQTFFVGTSGTPDNGLFFFWFTFIALLPNPQMPQYEIGYVTMKAPFFLVVQNMMLVDLAPPFPWP